jgi:hypothetical protein
MIQPIELDKTYEFLIENISFDSLPPEILRDIFLDGRAFSHFIEPWLTTQFPLRHVKGCKEYDHVGIDDPETLYDAKTMTRGGCKFCPSNMLGAGRRFDPTVFVEKAKKLIYIVVCNVDFPKIQIRFVRGDELASRYPNGTISLSDRTAFYGC